MFRLNQDLGSLFDVFIPKLLRESLDPDSIEFLRVRALSALLFLSLLLLGFEIIILSVWHGLFDAALLKYDLIAFAVFALLGIQAVFFYRFRNYWLSALAFTSIYFLMVVILVVVSGGHRSPMKSLLLTCPFVAFMIGGKHEGIQTSLLVLAIGMVLAFLDSIGFDMPDAFSEENPRVIFAVDWCITVSVVAICLLIYESALQRKPRCGGKRTAAEPDFFYKLVDRTLFWITPPKLKAMPEDHPDNIRARSLSGVLSLVIISGVATAVPMGIWYWVWGEGFPGQMVSTLVFSGILALLIFQGWFYYRVGNYQLSGFLIGITYFACLAGLILGSGAYQSPIKYFLLTCPLVSFMVGGIRDGLQTSLYVFLLGIALAWFEQKGVRFDDLFTGGTYPRLIFSVNWATMLSIIVGCIVMYDAEVNRRQ